MDDTALALQDAAEMAAYLALPRREQIASLTADLLAEPGAHVEFPVRHIHLPGHYVRVMLIRAGQLVIGKVHRVECVNICARGDIDIVTEQGDMRVGAGFVAVSAPGTQKIGYAHTDTVWINIFQTDEQDIDKLEEQLVYTDVEAIALLDPAGKYFKMKELECQ